ncbi:MAG: DUF6624 domain-containing protein [Gemmatimonas sp.]
MNAIMKYATTALAGTIILGVFTAGGVAAQASATSKSPASQPGACKFNPTDAWVVRQSAFFDDAGKQWTDDTLRVALLKAAGLVLPLKLPVNFGVQIDGATPPLGATANEMIEQLKKLAAVRGSAWPTKSVVGAAGTHAVYLLAQQDTGLARTVLHRMMEAGPLESPAIDVAVFEDHMRLVWGRKQLYGTQFKSSNGKIVLAAMEDSAHADMRRVGAGLPPFKLGTCFAQQR